MTSSKPSHLALLGCALVAGLVSVSCGSGGASPPNAYVASTLGSGGAGTCNLNKPSDTPFLAIGTQGNPASSGTGGVVVVCQVQATSASSYNVNAQVTDGALGGFNFSGVLSDETTTQTGFTAEFTSGVNSYNESEWTFTLTTEQTPPITSGRVWGTLMCPNLTDSPNSDHCAAQAEFILQNCSD